MGREVTTTDIYRAPMTAFIKRLNAMHPALLTTPPHQRIIIINTLLISLFSYLIEFFIIPYPIVTKINSLCSAAVGPFKGKALTYLHLSAHADDFGPKQPLRDLWSASIARIASQFDLDSYNGAQEALPEPSKAHLTGGGLSSMLIEEHIATAAYEYLNDWAPRDDDDLISTNLPTNIDGNPEGLD